MGEFDRLRTFLAIHRTGSVSEAARRLQMSQPAVTQQLRAMETSANRRLFRRLPRGMEATPAGRELAEQLGTHLDAVEEAWGQWLIRTQHEGDALRGGSVYLGGPSEFLTRRVLPALEGLVGAGVRIRVSAGDDAFVLKALEARELGLGVLTGMPEVHRDLTLEPLVREDFVLVAAPDVAAEIGEVRPGQRGAKRLQDVPLLAHSEDLPLIRPFWQEVFGADPNVVAAVVADSLPALVALAERGIGITVLPRHVCEEALATGQLVRLVEPKVAPATELYLAWSAGSRRTPSVAAVYERIHAVMHTIQT